MLKFKHSVIFLCLGLTNLVIYGLPSINSESKEMYPGNPYVDMQDVLRRLFRNSKEMDQTGFHEGEEEVESSYVSRQEMQQLKNTLQPEDGAGQEYENTSESDAILKVGVAETQNDTGYQMESGGSTDGVENELNDEVEQAKNASSPVNLHVQENKTEVIDSVTGDKIVAHSGGIPSLEILAPPHQMIPPPFLTTKPINGYRYIYQLRYPISAQQPPPDDDFLGLGLNHKTVQGPPSQIDLLKLLKGTTRTSVPLGISAPPPPRGTPSEAQSDSYENTPTSSIFIFVKFNTPSKQATN